MGASVFAQPKESVTAYLTNSQAQFTDELWLVSPRVVFVGTNKDVARTSTLQVDLNKPLALGTFPAGAELVFAIHPNVGTPAFRPGFAQPASFRWGPLFGPTGWFGSPRDWFFSGSWTRLNSDGAPHEQAQFFTGAPTTAIGGQSAAYLGFEDSRCCGPYLNIAAWAADPKVGADFNDAGLVVTRVSAATCRPKDGRSDGSEDLLTAESGLSARRVSDAEIEVSDGRGHTQRVRCNVPGPHPTPTPPPPAGGSSGGSSSTGTGGDDRSKSGPSDGSPATGTGGSSSTGTGTGGDHSAGGSSSTGTGTGGDDRSKSGPSHDARASGATSAGPVTHVVQGPPGSASGDARSGSGGPRDGDPRDGDRDADGHRPTRDKRE